MNTEIDGRVDITYRPAFNYFKNDAVGATNPAREKIGQVLTQAFRHAGPLFAKPAGIDSRWEVNFVVTVDTDKSRWW